MRVTSCPNSSKRCYSATCTFTCRWLTCPIAVCVHVNELWGCNDFDQALCTRSAFQVSHDTLHVFLITLGRTNGFSCCLSFTLYMMSVLSWHMYNSFHMAVLYTARFSFSSSSSDSVVGVLLTPGVATGFCVFQTKNSDNISDVLRVRFNRVPTDCSYDHSAQKELLIVKGNMIVLLHQSFHNTHHDLA